VVRAAQSSARALGRPGLHFSGSLGGFGVGSRSLGQVLSVGKPVPPSCCQRPKYPTERSLARRNFARLGVVPGRCRVFTADAASFSALDEYSHIYFYHPFTGLVMRDVATNIRASLIRRPRLLTIIYYNAVFVDELTTGDRFRIVARSFDRERNLILVLQSAVPAGP
jgi:hypothetical protein